MNISNDHVQCVNCKHLMKLPYSEAYPTHHENWKCRSRGITMNYELTVAYQKCSSYKQK